MNICADMPLEFQGLGSGSWAAPVGLKCGWSHTLVSILYFGTEDGCNFTVNYDKIKYFNTLAVNPLKVWMSEYADVMF